MLMDPESLRAIADRYRARLIGRDLSIRRFGIVTGSTDYPEVTLSFADSLHWAERAGHAGVGAVVVPHDRDWEVPAALSALEVRQPVADQFHQMFVDSVHEGRWPILPTRVDPRALIAHTAVIHEGVIIEAGARVMDYAVILPNSLIGQGVTVKPHATIGSDGFQIANLIDGRGVVPHVGGVHVAAGAAIGANTCVDRGLFGEFTRIGERAMIDNLVHVAHSAVVEADATVVATAEVSGSVRIGEGAWIGPNSTINPGLNVGDYAFVGSGAMVTRDVPRHALVYGSPARVKGLVCSCRQPLEVGPEPLVECAACHRTWSVADELDLKERA